MSYDCPKGHTSDDAEYCSECGSRIVGAPLAPPGAAAARCPVCETPRVSGARFCEVCRFDFVAGRPSQALPDGPSPDAAPAADAPVAPSPPPPAAPTMGEPEFLGRNLWVVVRADKALMSDADRDAATFPADEPRRSFPLDMDENLVGRANGRPGLHPEIAVRDPSVSARHLKLCRRDGGLYLVDVGSSNGTTVNGADAPAGVEVALRVGDRVRIGMWTEILIEAR